MKKLLWIPISPTVNYISHSKQPHSLPLLFTWFGDSGRLAHLCQCPNHTRERRGSTQTVYPLFPLVARATCRLDQLRYVKAPKSATRHVVLVPQTPAVCSTLVASLFPKMWRKTFYTFPILWKSRMCRFPDQKNSQVGDVTEMAQWHVPDAVIAAGRCIWVLGLAFLDFSSQDVQCRFW